MSSAGSGKPRAEPRVRRMVRARLRDDAGERDMCIIDISSRGLLATCARPPARGEFIEVTVGRNCMTAQVKWASERRFGLALRERVSIAALVEGGEGAVALAGSGAVARRGHGGWQAIRANPAMLGRMVQTLALLCAALAAAYLINEGVAAGLGPLGKTLSLAGR